MAAQGSLFDVDLPEDPGCWVYLIGVPGRSVAKIGKAQDVFKRLGSLQTSHPERLFVLWRTPGGRDLERRLQDHFGDKRLVGEWFDFGDEDPIEAVSAAAIELGSAAGEPLPLDEDDAPEEDGPSENPQGIEYSLYPADDDPDRDDPLYAPFHDAGCRYFTPTESASWGYDPGGDAVWVLCGMRAAYHF